MRQSILALDLGVACGWAFGHVGDPCPAADVFPLAHPEIGGIMSLALDRLETLFERHKPDVLAIEDALPQRNNNHDRTARITLGLHAIADMVGVEHGLSIGDGTIMRPSVNRVRAQVCGRAYLTKLEASVRPRVTVKKMIVDPWLAKMRWDIVDDHNARDAAVLWAYCESVLRRDALIARAQKRSAPAPA